MNYKFNVKKENYSLFASGSVLYSLPGQPAFPVRLSSEIFQRCVEILSGENIKPPYSVYDPFCGSGYLITTLGFIHADEISGLTGSDISETAVALANQNLNLLSETGLSKRECELENLFQVFRKESHFEAVKNIKRIKSEYLSPRLEKTDKKIFQADALSANLIGINISVSSIDLVITDLPYGHQTNWFVNEHSAKSTNDLIDEFLEAIRRFVKSEGLVILTTHEKIKFSESPNYARIRHFKTGHRYIYMLRIN